MTRTPAETLRLAADWMEAHAHINTATPFAEQVRDEHLALSAELRSIATTLEQSSRLKQRLAGRKRRCATEVLYQEYWGEDK